jgi:hypothetical protein
MRASRARSTTRAKTRQSERKESLAYGRAVPSIAVIPPPRSAPEREDAAAATRAVLLALCGRARTASGRGEQRAA